MTNQINVVIGNGGLSGAGDATLAASILTITDNGNPTSFPQAIYNNISNIGAGVQGSLIETPQQYIVTPTASKGQFALTLAQNNSSNGFLVRAVLGYNDTSATPNQTEICDGLRTSLTGTPLQITATGTLTLILTGKAGSPLIDTIESTGVGVLAIASNMPNCTTAARAGATTLDIIDNTGTAVTKTLLPNVLTSIAGTSTVTVTSNAHALVVGMSVNISGTWTGDIIQNGVTYSGGGSVTARVATVATNSFTLDGVTGANSLAAISASTLVTVVAQEQMGQGYALAASNEVFTGAQPLSGNSYSTFSMLYGSDVGNINGLNQSITNGANLYANEGASNYGTWLAQLNGILSDILSAAAIPAAVSKQ